MSKAKAFLKDFLLIDKQQTYGAEHFNILATIFCRSILIAFGIYFTYFIACSLGAKYYGLLVFNLIIAAECFMICVFRKGVEFKW